MQNDPIQAGFHAGADITWLRDLVRLREQLRHGIDALDALDDRFREALNDAYMQGVRDAVEHETHVDPIHGRHDREER
jgi:hypothetical protein